MTKYRNVFLLLLLVAIGATEDEQRDKTLLKRSQSYEKPEDPTFFSKIANWLYPFGAGEPDSETAASGNHGEFRYLPPPQAFAQPEKECNPCNQEPWIPMASNNGHQTVINFVPPYQHQQEVTHLEALPPNHFYGHQSETTLQDFIVPPPVNFKGGFVTHNRLNNKYGPPTKTQIPGGFYGPPKPNYGPPNHKPPPPIYGPPPQPKPQYGSPPLNQQYGPPLPPLNQQYGSPPLNQQYGSPPLNQQYGPPPPPLNQQYRPPPNRIPTTHLSPIQEFRPPPVRGTYGPPIHSQKLIPTSPSTSYGAPQPPLPSDSYGEPLGQNAVDYYQQEQEQEQNEPLPLPSGHSNNIPLPNLSLNPVVPIREPVNFKQVAYQTGNEANVQVLPSINVADFLSSVEHPINVIQSPLVEVSVKDQFEREPVDLNEPLSSSYQQEPRSHGDHLHGLATAVKENYLPLNHNNHKLSENPIVVEDNFNTTKRDNNKDLSNVNEINTDLISKLLREQGILDNPNNEILDIKKVNDPRFMQPTVDYSRWKPQTQSTWLKPVESTTKKPKPKPVQIIIPYISKKPNQFDRPHFVQQKTQDKSIGYTTLVPMYTPPSSTEISHWSKFMDDYNLAESRKVTSTSFTKPQTTPVYNIKEVFNLNPVTNGHQQGTLPFDVINLQKNIDHWTQQEFNTVHSNSNNNKEVAKQIPQNYFSSSVETTTISDNYESAESTNRPNIIKDLLKEIESNLVISETTTTTESAKSNWEVAQVTVSPLTKEKVYVVTPQSYKFDSSTPATAWSMAPKIENGQINNDSLLSFRSSKFSVRVEPENKVSRDLVLNKTQSVKVVYSEWPHLINNLQTSTTPKPTSRHPLFGLMDLSSYTPPPNSTVQTFLGHSKVVTVVTPSTISKKSSTIPIT